MNWHGNGDRIGHVSCNYSSQPREACFTVALLNLYLVVVHTGTKKKNINKVIQIVTGPHIAVFLGWEENLLQMVWSGEGPSEDKILSLGFSWERQPCNSLEDESLRWREAGRRLQKRWAHVAGGEEVRWMNKRKWSQRWRERLILTMPCWRFF